MTYLDTWADLRRIADALDARVDMHGLIDIKAYGEGRYVLVDRDKQFRVGLYEADIDLPLVIIETPTVDDTIAAARTLSRTWVEVAQVDISREG
jgi:hypothetical protein